MGRWVVVEMNTFRITFRYKNTDNQIVSQEIDIGLIQSIAFTYNIQSTDAGIPSQPSQNAFVMDYGVSRSHTFKYRRVNPQNPVDDITGDSTKWSNGFWVYVIKRYIVNRWQTETDGCKISYVVPQEDSELYTSIPLTNVYVDSFSVEQTAGDVSSLNGSITFIVGATNLTKVVAKHTIIYDANYGSYSASGIDDPTNYVNVTNNDSTSAMSLPSSWRSRAVDTYSISVDDDKFVWSTDAVPNQSSTLYEPGDLINFDSDITGDMITLYAIYDSSNPPSGV